MRNFMRDLIARPRIEPEAEAASDAPKNPIFDIGLLAPQRRERNEADIRGLCQTVTLPDAVLCRVLGRYKMYVDPGDTGIAPHLMLDGIWEMPVTEALVGFVRRGMRVVDVGANQGYFSMLMAELVGPEGYVYAAEPNPRMMSLLQRSASVNGFTGRIQPIAQPLSARVDEPVVLQIPSQLPQNASIVGAGSATSEGIALTTTTLDELIGDGPVDFIKIDVEGAEELVWTGMARTLARRQALAVFIEFTPDRYADPRGFLSRMLETGFALGIVTGQHGVMPVSIDEVLAGPINVDRMLTLVR